MAHEEFNLVIVNPFSHKGKSYTKGQMITDPAEVTMLHTEDREAHFVRIAAPPPPAPVPVHLGFTDADKIEENEELR